MLVTDESSSKRPEYRASNDPEHCQVWFQNRHQKKKKKPINQTGKQKGTLGTSRVQLSDRRTLNDLDSEVSGLGSDV